MNQELYAIVNSENGEVVYRRGYKSKLMVYTKLSHAKSAFRSISKPDKCDIIRLGAVGLVYKGSDLHREQLEKDEIERRRRDERYAKWRKERALANLKKAEEDLERAKEHVKTV